jgi:frataxin-like iron-binding protein CyaY
MLLCKGKKNNAVPYLKGPQGIGKSFLSEMLQRHVLGMAISMKSSAEPLLSRFNKILLGMLFVFFEEFPSTSEREWASISSKLKDLVTGFDAMYEDKNEKSIRAANISNYIINTNDNAIKHSEGRRFFVVDVSTKRMQDAKYFGNIAKRCCNDRVGEALFAYFKEIDTTNFDAQHDMPETKSKLDAIAERLDMVYKFIKDEYILQGQSMIKVPLEDLHNNFLSYCNEKNYKTKLGKISFAAKLTEVNIQTGKQGGYHFYNYSIDQLKEIATKHKWIHEFDTVACNERQVV